MPTRPRLRWGMTMAHASCNADALSAAEQFVHSRVDRLYLHGESGTGKTHLLTAILREAHRLGYGRSARMYRAGEWLIQRQPSDGVRLLLVDDVHVVAGSPQACGALTEAIREVLGSGGQVAVASLSSLPARNRQRVGLDDGWRVAELRRPARADRLMLLEQMSRQNGQALDRVLLWPIAERVGGALRGLQGALNRVLALRDQCGEAALTPARIVGLLVPLESAGACEELFDAVCMIVRRSESEQEAFDRKAYLSCLYAGVTEAIVADWLGASRSSVHHAVCRIADRAKSDPDFRRTIEDLQSALDWELVGRRRWPAGDTATGFAKSGGGSPDAG